MNAMAVTTQTTTRPSFGEPSLDDEIRRLRRVDNLTNLGYIAWEYLSLAIVIGGTVAFCEYRAGWGLTWALNIPVFALAIVLIGGLQHRLAGLGHEASHYTLLRHKFLNDFLGDILCMFPIVSTVHFYRVFHLAHHQYTNDPQRDPDLVSLGGSKMVDRFPMGRWEFIKSIYLRGFTEPKAVMTYQQDYFAINVLGSSSNVYLKRVPGLEESGRAWPRLGASLAIVYLAVFIAGTWLCTITGWPGMLWALGVLGTLVLLTVGNLLPKRAFFPSPFRQPYSSRFGGILRLVYMTWFLTAMSVLRAETGGRSTMYLYLLWFVPIVTTFSFFMLLRDVYQHTNADDGRLTNSRVFFADPFTRWAVFVYGQDIHIPHHLFPAVPHYRLPKLHRLLKARHAEYAARVVECHGTFSNDTGAPTILDTLTEHRVRA